MATKSIWERMQEIDVRWIYLAMWIAISIPILRPIGIPLGKYSIETLGLYNYIEGLRPGSVVVHINDMSPAAAPECHPALIALIQHCINKGLKVLVYSARTEAVPFSESAIMAVLGATKDHPEYGKRIVNLGFIPQYEVGLAALASNIFYTGRDVYGNKLEDMPFFKDLPTKTARDWSLVIYYGASSVDWVVRQITDVYGVRAAGGIAAVLASRVYPYFPDKVVGFTNGLKGAAEYEILVRRPGEAAAGMDAQSLGHLAVILFIIAGNAGYFVTRRRRR